MIRNILKKITQISFKTMSQQTSVPLQKDSTNPEDIFTGTQKKIFQEENKNLEGQTQIRNNVDLTNFNRIIENNKKWSAVMMKQDPEYFSKLVDLQKQEYLWIGCADSRVPANQIIGLQPGQIFVHRNIANQAPPSDINCLAVIQYAVEVLKVKDIIVTGHYGCGGIKAAFRKHNHGPLECWLSHIREVRAIYRKQLIYSQEQNWNKLCQLNVKHQVYNVARVPCVQQAWKNGEQLRIHGLVYDLKDGILKDLGITLSDVDHLPQEYKIII